MTCWTGGSRPDTSTSLMNRRMVAMIQPWVSVFGGERGGVGKRREKGRGREGGRKNRLHSGHWYLVASTIGQRLNHRAKGSYWTYSIRSAGLQPGGCPIQVHCTLHVRRRTTGNPLRYVHVCRQCIRIPFSVSTCTYTRTWSLRSSSVVSVVPQPYLVHITFKQSVTWKQHYS